MISSQKQRTSAGSARNAYLQGNARLHLKHCEAIYVWYALDKTYLSLSLGRKRGTRPCQSTDVDGVQDAHAPPTLGTGKRDAAAFGLADDERARGGGGGVAAGFEERATVLVLQGQVVRRRGDGVAELVASVVRCARGFLGFPCCSCLCAWKNVL